MGKQKNVKRTIDLALVFVQLVGKQKNAKRTIDSMLMFV